MTRRGKNWTSWCGNGWKRTTIWRKRMDFERIEIASVRRDLNDLYQQVILDHCKKPRNFHELPQATCSAQGHNPLCGDQLQLFLALDGDTIKDISFVGSGCCISKASASLLTEFAKAKRRRTWKKCSARSMKWS